METTIPIALSVKDLLSLYLNRPRNLISLDFGAWFCNGADINDDTLHNMNCASGIPHVKNAGYDTTKGLYGKLYRFNDLYSD